MSEPCRLLNDMYDRMSFALPGLPSMGHPTRHTTCAMITYMRAKGGRSGSAWLCGLRCPTAKLGQGGGAGATRLAGLQPRRRIRILAPSGANPPLCTLIQTYGLFGMAVLLLVEVILYLSIDLLGLNLWIANTAAFVAVVCWVTLGWRFMGDACQSPSGPANAAEHE